MSWCFLYFYYSYYLLFRIIFICVCMFHLFIFYSYSNCCVSLYFLFLIVIELLRLTKHAALISAFRRCCCRCFSCSSFRAWGACAWSTWALTRCWVCSFRGSSLIWHVRFSWAWLASWVIGYLHLCFTWWDRTHTRD